MTENIKSVDSRSRNEVMVDLATDTFKDIENGEELAVSIVVDGLGAAFSVKAVEWFEPQQEVLAATRLDGVTVFFGAEHLRAVFLVPTDEAMPSL